MALIPLVVVIGGEVHSESDDEGVDHSKKLKGLETLSKSAQFKLNIKKARKVSKHDFFIQQHLRGSSEGFGVTLEVPDELTLKRLNEGVGVIPKVPNKPSDYYRTSSYDSEFEVEDILSDKADVTEKADESKKTDDEKAEEEHPEATKVSASLTLSSAEFTSQFFNDNPYVNVNEVLNDPVEHEVQSMVDIPVQQAKPAKQRPPLVDTTITLFPDPTTVSPTQPPPTPPKRRKLKIILKKYKRPESHVDVDAIDKSVKAYLKKVLPADVHDIGKIKMVKAAKKSMPKYSPKPFDQASLSEFDQKDKLFQMMSKSMSYNRYPSHKALYDSLAISPSVDEDVMDKELKELPVQKKTRTTPSKPSNPNKFVQAEETVKELDQEVEMNDEEPAMDEVVNYGKYPHDDTAPSQDRSKWFKQSPRPETPDPDWHKEPNADDGPELMWFNDLVHAEKDPLTFDDLMGSIVDFTKFIMNHLKKDIIYKADLEGPTFMLLKGTCESQIKLEYNFK
uniref:Uncharacterized protein n=1 Tax=Tanacetum cinerariifolium TaxID=118510 RepID=A0A6L2LU93_TANCI|nr:hypothetical protein [Tanacetum cinerariifolium]